MGDKENLKRITAEMERIGKKACEIATEAVMNEKYDCNLLYKAIDYFVREFWGNFLHPALVAIACEAVGGDPEKTTLVGASLVLLTGAADVHDDIIDKSKTKGTKETVFGKFGEDISLLVGDALLFEGLVLLDIACKNFPEEIGKAVKELIKRGFFELGAAEAMETTFKGNWNIHPEMLFEVIRRKSAVAEATARAGAIIGNATSNQVEDWGKIGRILSISSSIKSEFVDMFEAEELMNRRDNESLPLPILYAISNPKIKSEIARILKKRKLDDDDAMKVADVVLETKEVKRLKAEMHSLVKEGNNILNKYKKCSKAKLLIHLLNLAKEDI